MLILCIMSRDFELYLEGRVRTITSTPPFWEQKPVCFFDSNHLSSVLGVTTLSLLLIPGQHVKILPP